MEPERTVVYGSSDDLVEIAGHLNEEFGVNPDLTQYVGLSNGVLLKVNYDGEWNIRRVTGTFESWGLDIIPARGEDEPADEDGCPGYSDKVVIHGPIAWAIVGTDLVK